MHGDSPLFSLLYVVVVVVVLPLKCARRVYLLRRRRCHIMARGKFKCSHGRRPPEKQTRKEIKCIILFGKFVHTWQGQDAHGKRNFKETAFTFVIGTYYTWTCITCNLTYLLHLLCSCSSWQSIGSVCRSIYLYIGTWTTAAAETGRVVVFSIVSEYTLHYYITLHYGTLDFWSLGASHENRLPSE